MSESRFTDDCRVLVEVFTAPNCNRCGQAARRVAQVVDALNHEQVQWRKVDVVDNLDYAVQVGVLATPAIAINAILIFTGLPDEAKLRTAILNSLNL